MALIKHKRSSSFPNFPLLRLALLSVFLLSATIAVADATASQGVDLTKCLEKCQSLGLGPMVRTCEQYSCKMGELGKVRDEEDPKLTKCLEECRSQPHYDIGMEKKCEERCRQDQEHQPEYRRHDLNIEIRSSSNPHWRYDQQHGQERQEDNPFVFHRERFRYEIGTNRGYMKVLDKFHHKSKLLLGIANYSISLLVANPHTFVTPVHFDADCVCYVVQGRGTVTTLTKGERKSHEIRQGDVFVTESGSILYLVSSHRREKLVLAKFLRSTSLTGQISHFYAAAGENPESVYRSFSDEVLEAAFNVPRDRVERVFSRQREGTFIEASEEQIQALSRHTKQGGRWPFGESRGPFNLLQKDPTHSNRHGELYEADSDDDRKLGQLNLRVSLANISKGAMMAPFYNSRSTKFAMVTEGSGYVEILCPHLAREGQHGSQPQRYREREGEPERWGREGGRYGEEGVKEEEEYEGRRQGQRYRRVRAHVSHGTVFIVPPSHPVVEVASHDQNLQTICFEIHADSNERFFLAGRNNILRKMEREAKELAFDTSARKVDAVFNAQHEEVFFPGPGAHRQWYSHGESEEWGGSDTNLAASLFGIVAGF